MKTMKTRNLFITVLFASMVSLIAMACNDKAAGPAKIGVDQDVKVAIYSTTENGCEADTISLCLIEETAHISELLHYPGEKGVTMPFNFYDTFRYSEITEGNLDKRIAISVNGQVVSTPVVKMKLDNGACSVVLDEAQVSALFPNVNIKELLN